MQCIKAPINICMAGHELRRGAFGGGSKGKRYALPHARIMIHALNLGRRHSGQGTDSEIESKELRDN
jgi:ATP-dependent Clp protease protease subunit